MTLNEYCVQLRVFFTTLGKYVIVHNSYEPEKAQTRVLCHVPKYYSVFYIDLGFCNFNIDFVPSVQDWINRTDNIQ